MKRGDLVAFAAVMLLTLFALGAAWVIPSYSEESRVYPYAGGMYRFETGLAPRLYAEGGLAYSLGPLAPSLTLQVPVTGKFAVGGELRLRIKL